MRKPQGRIHAREGRPLQVAAVCYRCQSGAIRFLLVHTSSGRWTFPKGRVEDGLSHAEIAALEAFEEGGIDGKLDPRPIGRFLHRKESLRGYRSKDVMVLAFLLQAKRCAVPAESHRRPRWFTPDEAKQRLAKGRPTKYRRSMDRILESALRKIARKHSQS